MPEPVVEPVVADPSGGDHYTAGEDYASLSDEAKQTVAKHENPVDTVKAYAELSKKLGSSYRLPDDLKTLSVDDQADIVTKMRGLRNIPETAEGYEITVAEGVERNTPFEAAAKALAFEIGTSPEDLQKWADFWTNARQGSMEAENQDAEKDAQKAETEHRMKHGVNFDQKMKEVDMCRELAAKDLNLNYKDPADPEKQHSKLDDALNMKDVNGRCLGNHPAMLDFLNLFYDKQYKESNPVLTGGEEPGSTGDGTFSKKFYENPTPG